jgi:predicted dehydrogenase
MTNTHPANIKRWQVVLVGIGGYGQNYVEAALERARQGILQIVGIVDPIAPLSGQYEKVAHLPCYPDLESFYRLHQADLAIISSPIHYHASQVCTALAHGSHVLCEKPLCATAEEARAMRLAYHASRRIGAIGFQWSFSAPVLQAKQEILDSRWGAFRQMRCMVNWPRPFAYYRRNNWAGRVQTDQGEVVLDSILNNATAHYLHQILFFLGDALTTAALPDALEAACYRAYPIETYDTAFIRMMFGSVPAFIAVSHVTHRLLNPQFEFVLEKGTFTCTGDDHLRLTTSDGRIVDYGSMSVGTVDGKLDAVIRAMSTGEPIPCDIDTASAHAEVIQRINQIPVRIFAPERVETLNLSDRHEERLAVIGLEELMDRCYANLECPEPNVLASVTTG